MRNGFYILQEACKGDMPTFLEELDNMQAELPIQIDEDGDLAVVSVGSFLQGFCGELAKYFEREYGIPIGILYDPSGADIRLLHVFNVFTEGSVTYYLDARGITDDPKLFMEPFAEPGRDLKMIGFPSSEAEAKAAFGDEWDFPEDNISDAMIRWLLTSFPENYRHPGLSPPLPLTEQIQAAAQKAAKQEIPSPVRIRWLREEAGSYHSEDGRFDVINVYDRMLGSHWRLWDRKTNQTYEKDTLKECKWVAEGHVLPRERQEERSSRQPQAPKVL